MIRQTVENVKLNSTTWRTSAQDLAQVIRNVVYSDLDLGATVTVASLHNGICKTHASNLHLLGIYRLVSFQRFMRIAVAGIGIRPTNSEDGSDEVGGGILYKVPIPTKEELITRIVDWRSKATGMSIGIDDLERELITNYFCEFTAFGLGKLPEFLTDNGFVVMEVRKTLFFPPTSLLKAGASSGSTTSTATTSSSSSASTDQSSLSSSSSDKPSEGSECVVCMDAKPDSVIITCGHMCMCGVCARGLKLCPLCRQAFTPDQVIKVFVL